ncbi:MAG: hypothetical protein R3F25_03400 [Gammaproteobacteria bacterium]
MNEYLIGMIYHYPKDYENWLKGYVEDYEAATAVYIDAPNEKAALDWGYEIATALLNFVNNSDGLTLEQFQHHCWYIEDPESCDWSRMLDSFLHVKHGEMPNLNNMIVK